MKKLTAFCLSLAAAGLFGSTVVEAASLPYVVTDLGQGNAALASDRGLVLAPGGAMGYTFRHIDHAVSDVAGTVKALPPLSNAPTYSPMAYGNPANAYSSWSPTGLFLNDQSQLVATNFFGVSGHYASAGSQVMVLDRAADGSFVTPRTLFTSSENMYTGGQVARALDLNNAGQVLGVTESPSTGRDYLIYDLRTASAAHLANLLAGWTVLSASAIDEDGRILLSAYRNGESAAHALLLSPESAVPQAVPVPEPSTLATIVVGSFAWSLTRRRWRGVGTPA